MEKLKYQMSSRATILLGRESVSKVDGAIIELIKNTYDADAEFCYICFDVENDHIYILDDGNGMTKSIIQQHWMLIGTDNKRDQFVSAKKRIKSGEKGIGRFALDRLGSKCKMYTKHDDEQLIYWFNDWSRFEQTGKTIDDMEADFSYINKSFAEIVPRKILDNIDFVSSSKSRSFFNLNKGTLFEISGLRDKWSARDIEKIISVLGFLVPPVEQKDYTIWVQSTIDALPVEIDSDIADEYDYKVKAAFDGTKITAKIFRNEFDLKIMPKELFESKPFNIFPYRYTDFSKQPFEISATISELTGIIDSEFLDTAKKVGTFEFHYTFMKLSGREEGPYYYKPVSQKRRTWLNQHGGVKIYRDNFVVRPYGDPHSNSYDWLGLDSRKGINPVAISHKSGQWHVNNSQIQGTVLISRTNNGFILDKSSREGIIENEYFNALSIILRAMISLFEKDRAYIVRNIKQFSSDQDNKEKTKSDAQNIADEVLGKKRNQHDLTEHQTEQEKQTTTLAEAVQLFKEEREDLISEINLLRALATNGLMTTSMVHDLKSINALLVSRVRGFRVALRMNDAEQVERNLRDLQLNDEFLKSWITVITTQSKSDRRHRRMKDLNKTIRQSLKMLKPILDRKQISINFTTDGREAKRRIFESDFDSIIYNLIINSIESFEDTKCSDRIINIAVDSDDAFHIHYLDNGRGLPVAFENNPYKIFEYGVTSKYDVEGNQTGTGLGMYIVASSITEYGGEYSITKMKNGFGMNISIPLQSGASI